MHALAVCSVAEDDSWVRLEICDTLVAICSVALDCWLAAVAICVVLFALGHANQPWRMVVIALVPMSVGLHYLVLWSGSLYPAMATHFLYDFCAGFLFIRLARERRSTAVGIAAGD